VHLKESLRRDVPAFARPIGGAGERRRVLTRILALIDGSVPDDWIPSVPEPGRAAMRANLARIAANLASELPRWEAESPLVEIRF
jgi:hypothetical protein